MTPSHDTDCAAPAAPRRSFLQKHRFTLAVAGLFALTFVAVIALLGWRVRTAFYSVEPTTDAARYPAIVADHAVWSSRYEFLPASIDPDAEAVAFFHRPKSPQGGDVIALRLRLPEEDGTALLAVLQASGRQEIQAFPPDTTPLCYPDFGIGHLKSDKDYAGALKKLPAGFRIFLYETMIQAGPQNHSFIAFTAVSPEKREVVYYAEWY